MSKRSYHGATSRSGSTMKDRSDDPLHHERTLLPRSYISLPTPRANALTTELHLAPCTTSERSYHGATSRSLHHERTLLPRSYISLPAPRANALTTELHLAPCTTSERSYHGATSRSGSTMKDRSDDPLHHERTLLPRSYISLLSGLQTINGLQAVR